MTGLLYNKIIYIIYIFNSIFVALILLKHILILNIFRTKYEIDGVTDFFGTQPHWVGYSIEYFLKNYTEKKLLEHIQIIEQECLKSYDISNV